MDCAINRPSFHGAVKMANLFGVKRLINEVKETKGTPSFPFALEALGEAGGPDAVTALMEILDSYPVRDDRTYPAAVKALGRASRAQ